MRRAAVCLLAAWMNGADAAGSDIIFLEPKGAPPALTGEAFERAFSNPSLETSRRALRRQPIDLFDAEAIRKQARELVKNPPALVVTPAARPASILKEEGASFPVLFVSLGDPRFTALVVHPERPEGSLTGYTYHLNELLKPFEIARELAGARGVAGFVVDTSLHQIPAYQGFEQRVEAATGMKVVTVTGDDPVEVERQCKALREKVDAWVVPDTRLTREHAVALTRVLVATGAIVIVEPRSMLEAGAHVRIVAVAEEPMRILAEMGDLVLAGVPISRIPVARPKRVQLILNRDAVASKRDTPWRDLLLRADGFYP